MKYICIPCGYLYDSEQNPSLPEWSELPYQWRCPDCGTAKVNFVEFDPDKTDTD